jgi:hypothetical protein
MGSIVTSKPPKIPLGTGDMVYTNVGTKNGVSVGDMFTVFRTSKPEYHPVTGRKIGYKVQIEEELELVEILGKRKSTGIITSSYVEVTRGAKIRP